MELKLFYKQGFSYLNCFSSKAYVRSLCNLIASHINMLLFFNKRELYLQSIAQAPGISREGKRID